MYEKAATITAPGLIQLLGRLTRNEGRLTAVLHRGDALAMVYGTAQPSFALHAGAIEAADLTLNALVPGQMCATHGFIAPLCPGSVGLGTGLGLELEYDRNDLVTVTNMFQEAGLAFHPQAASCACRGIGIRKVFFLSAI